MITWGGGHNCKQGAHPHALTGGPKCAGTVSPSQDFHFNHCICSIVIERTLCVCVVLGHCILSLSVCGLL